MPHTWPDYELLDFGGGRKLERFGQTPVDRPSPAAAGVAPLARDWPEGVRYSGAKVSDGSWSQAASQRLADGVTVPLGAGRAFRVELDLTPAGQVGLFPEQFPNWRWLAERVAAAGRPLRVLNLFAYTGASTLAAAAAGAEVTHVDASKPSVERARANAALSGLAGAPIRWIIEDALKYCRREVKRGSQYDAVILDPPSYGHGPKGEEWKLERDLPALLGMVGELTRRQPAFLLATCHTPGVGPAELATYLADGVFGSCGQAPASGRLWLTTRDGRRLESGVYARWPR